MHNFDLYVSKESYLYLQPKVHSCFIKVSIKAHKISNIKVSAAASSCTVYAETQDSFPVGVKISMIGIKKLPDKFMGA